MPSSRILGAILLLATSLPLWPQSQSLSLPSEKHLKNVRQLTFGGQNAEAYFSADDKWLIFQHQGEGVPCDQMYIMPVDGNPPQPKLVSAGKGRTTCGYFFPAGDRILFSSTHLASAACPPKPDYSHGYVWPIYDTYQIFTATPDGSDLRQLTHAPGYNAEATISRDGKKIVFTSTRNGDLDIYTMNADGTHVRQLTHELGYDGGAFFSYDGKKIVFRAEHPKTPAEIADYKDLLARHLIRPGNLEIWVMNADGSHKRQVTHNGAANFAPYFLPDGKRIIFSSNMNDPKNGRDFDLYIINVDGTGLERITYAPDFDAFPMFSSDGKKLVWASNRNGKAPHETNIFIADWVDDSTPPRATAHCSRPRYCAGVPEKVAYPDSLKGSGMEGSVLLQGMVDLDGCPHHMVVVKGLNPVLDKLAEQHVMCWQFAPATKDGQPVSVIVQVSVDFKDPAKSEH